VTLSLPLPDGYATVAQFAPAFSLHDHVIGLEAITDFICMGYEGTLKQWQEYLAEQPFVEQPHA